MKRRLLQLGYRARQLYHKIRRPVTLGSRALVIQNDQVLLVRLTYYKGWFLPGGGVDKGESFHTAVERELLEECCLKAKDTKLFGVYLNQRNGKIDHVAIYAVTEFEGLPQCGDQNEIAEVRFFSKETLPEDLWSGHRRRIEEYFGHRKMEHTW